MCYLSKTIWRTIYIWYLHNICSLCKYYSLPACFPSSKFTSGMGFTSILRLELLLVLLSRVKWFSTFLWFTKSYTFLLIRYIFKRSIKKIRQISPRMSVPHTQQSFHFQKKLQGTYIIMNIFVWKFAESFLIQYMKKQSPMIKFEIKRLSIF